MTPGVNQLNNSHYLSPSELLGLEEERILDAIAELGLATGKTSEDADVPLVTLILPVIAQQIEVVRDRTSPSDRPLVDVFWARREVSIEERAFFFRHQAAFFQHIIPSSGQEIIAVAILKAAIRIGDAPAADDASPDLEEFLSIHRVLQRDQGSRLGAHVKRFRGFGATIHVCAKLKEEHPHLYHEVLRFVQLVIGEGDGGISEDNLINLIEAVTGAAIRGDIQDCMQEASPLMENLSHVGNRVLLLRRILRIEEPSNREHICRAVLHLIRPVNKAEIREQLVHDLFFNIKDPEEQSRACLQVCQFIEQVSYLRENGERCSLIIQDILQIQEQTDREERLALLSPIMESMSGCTTDDAVDVFRWLIHIQDREERRTICREIAAVIPEIAASDVFYMVGEILACKDAASREAIFQKYKKK